jgi:hypothetical protein
MSLSRASSKHLLGGRRLEQLRAISFPLPTSTSPTCSQICAIDHASPNWLHFPLRGGEGLDEVAEARRARLEQ